MRVLIIALLLGCSLPAAPAFAVMRATALDVDAGRIVLQLDGPATVRVFALAAPLRLVFDLDGVDAPRLLADGSSASIAKARIGQFDPATARMVVELKRPVQVARAEQGADNRLILTFGATTAKAFDEEVKRGRHRLAVIGAAVAVPVGPPPPRVAGAVPQVAASPDFDLPEDIFGKAATSAPVAIPPRQKPVVQPKVAPPPRSGGKKPLVVIDAGHGGKDVVAISVDGTYEKDATLAIARAAARALEATGRVRVKLTRSDDRFIPLGGRVAIARAARADLFVSIHADSAPNPGARGASVYTLSETASDVVAARLAARENKSDIIAGVNLGIEAPEVGDILIDLLQRGTMNTAIAFAETLQEELDDRIAFRGEFHHFAGFRVLKAADIPSVLLETGYVTNVDDATLLFSKAGQKTVGDGIARAVEAHLLRGR